MRRLYYFIYAACLILFGLLSYFAHQSGNLPGDSAITTWLSGIELPFVDSLMQVVSGLGDTLPSIITVIAVIILLLFVRRRLEAVFIAVLPGMAALLTWLIKVMVGRPRPGCEFIDNGGLSFPSGHVSHIVVLLGFLYYLLPGLVKQRVIVTALQAVMVILMLLMIASRVYLGEHWPSDVVGGLILGGLILVPAIVLYKHYTQRGGNARAA